MLGGEYLQNLRDRVEADLNDKSKPWTWAFDLAEKYAKIPRFYLLGLMILFVAIYVIVGPGARIVCFSVGVFYPLVKSCAAIEKGKEDPKETRRWLIYWTTFSCFSIFDIFASMVCLPFYWFFKCLLQIWWMMPAENAESAFYNVLQKMYLKTIKNKP